MNWSMPILAILQSPSSHLRARDAKYPLPMTVDGVPYFSINMVLCMMVPGWSDWQARKEMAEIIPVIERAMLGVA